MDDLAAYYFHQGTNYSAYKYLGCTMQRDGEKYVYTFRTWAPNAHHIELISDFVGWDYGRDMNRITPGGIWEIVIESDMSLEKAAYKFRITSASGVVCKGDPYARFSRGLDDGASLIFTSNSFTWTDGNWMRHRKRTVATKNGSYLASPVNIYEVHLGSFMRHEEDNSYLSYREAADTLASYAKAMGYTHVELLPIAEFPYDGSWGYQVCGFYAPTSRFGDPDDFRYFVNTLHKSGIGVIMDWVPAHFPKDQWGLYEFDGSPLYEYQGRDRQESRSWGTRFFDLGREEIQSFLISNALYFLREFHIDGLRVDAVASMLYLDYDRDPGEWIPNHMGTNLNLEAIAFFKKLNSAIFGEFPEALMIAEESTAYGNLTHPVHEGGLGFNMKWNMGWANDFYDYVMTDPLYRKHHHSALNFPLMYAFKENYCLPISHDEVVHGKKSFVDKMFGEYEDKFLQMRISLMLMMTYPGKKLTFMGTEYAQFREWDYESSLEWFMLDYPNHRHMRDYVQSLNSFYLSRSELWECDFDPKGFEWILADESDKNVVAYRRFNSKGDDLITVINFSGSEQTVHIPLKNSKFLDVLFASDERAGNENITITSENGEHYAIVKLERFSGFISKERKVKKYKIKNKETHHVL
ncbi:MAG: 1,4-alpha-glucan branching protein GlgB [Clostridia bacterium]|nr:1,4-alpha-glucan branching protein GlgB [Clostridia bacterium]